jgi:hypothetical protein
MNALTESAHHIAVDNAEVHRRLSPRHPVFGSSGDATAGSRSRATSLGAGRPAVEVGISFAVGRRWVSIDAAALWCAGLWPRRGSTVLCCAAPVGGYVDRRHYDYSFGCSSAAGG